MVGFGPKPHADPLVQVGHARVVDSDLGASKSDIRAIGVVTISERAGRTCSPTAHIWKGVVFPSRRLVDIGARLRYRHDQGAEFRLVVGRCSMAEPRDAISGKS